MLRAGIYLCPVCGNNLDSKAFCHACQRSFRDEVESNKKEELLDSQIAQQDKIDNACFELIKEFYPDAEWDQEQIGVVRDALIKVGVRYHGDSEFDLYPWLLEPEQIGNRDNTKLRLTLDVDYSPHGIPINALEDNLRRLVDIGIGEGLLTGYTEAVVESWSMAVERISEQSITRH